MIVYVAPELYGSVIDAFVNQNHVGFHGLTSAYAVDTDRDGTLDTLHVVNTNRPWNPWPDTALAVPVDALFDTEGNDFAWGEHPDEDLGLEAAQQWALLNLKLVFEWEPAGVA